MGLRCLTWADVAFRYGDRITSYPTAEELAFKRGGSLVVTPTFSKCDFTAEHWGNQPIPIPYENWHGNAAWRIARRYRRLGIESMSMEQRGKVALFGDEDGDAYTSQALNRLFKQVIMHVAPELKDVLTIHSYRIRLATKLRRAGECIAVRLERCA